jgi:dTDP-4-amino-4,6-dideoxygalactose transaminase
MSLVALGSAMPSHAKQRIIATSHRADDVLERLAIFGAPPAFRRRLHVGCPNIGNRRDLIERINHILDRRWLTNLGPCVQEFERRVAALAGVKHCIAMCNGTIALEVAIRALGMQGEVIVPAMTFIATAHALEWQGITPVFCDIHPETYTIDPAKVESLITPRTTGVIGVHLWGRPCDVKGLTEIAQRHRLRLLFDSAHALGNSHEGSSIGRFGDAEVFSFHATKFVNALEGGAVVTNDDEIAAKIRLIKNFGFVSLDRVVSIGTNGKMSEMSAAMGLTSLDSMSEFIEVNRRNYAAYQEGLVIPGVELLRYDGKEHNNFQYVVVEVDAVRTGISRDYLVGVLRAENVFARRYFYPGCHRMEPYRSRLSHAHVTLPVTERLAERVLVLPTGTGVKVEEIRRICEIMRLVASNGPAVRQRLQRLSRKSRSEIPLLREADLYENPYYDSSSVEPFEHESHHRIDPLNGGRSGAS